MIHTQDADFTLIQADVLDGLRTLEDGSVHCVVTSPPYWGLRDYGTGLWAGGDEDCSHEHGKDNTVPMMAHRNETERKFRSSRYLNQGEAPSNVCGKCGATRQDQQLGLEATPDLYVARIVEVFREVRRVLRADGTCWVNLGDSYVSTAPGTADHAQRMNGMTDEHRGGERIRPKVSGLKPKDLVGIPWRVAFALQADGWYLRSDIIWSKPNPMPESVTDRPTKAHEYVFLLSKQARYYFDAEAVREDGPTYTRKAGGYNGREAPGGRFGKASHFGGTGGFGDSDVTTTGRNVRSVWEIATQPYPEAHFATYPEELVRRCVLAGTSERGCCPVCGKPWERETNVDYEEAGRNNNSLKSKGGGDAVAAMSARPYETRMLKHVTTLGWRPGCNCGEAVDCPDCSTREEQLRCKTCLSTGEVTAPSEPIPCTVLDPFLGSGTTAYVARKHGRRSIGIELNVQYADLAARRMQQQSLLV